MVLVLRCGSLCHFRFGSQPTRVRNDCFCFGFIRAFMYISYFGLYSNVFSSWNHEYGISWSQHLSHDMWHFDKCILRRACAAPFYA